MVGDLLLAYAESVFLFLFILLESPQILLVGLADKLFEGLYYLLVAYLPVLERDLAALDSPDRLDDNSVALFELLTVGVKVIYLADLFESDSYNFCHINLRPQRPACLRSRVQSLVTIKL